MAYSAKWKTKSSVHLKIIRYGIDIESSAKFVAIPKSALHSSFVSLLSGYMTKIGG